MRNSSLYTDSGFLFLQLFFQLADRHSFNIHIIQCDEKIQRDVKVTTDEEFEKYMEDVELCGFGGTDFRPVFEYVDGLIRRHEFQDLKGLIYFTDGQGTFPERMPDYQTACGCTDILMHTMERYFNHGENMELTDGISEALMRTVIRNAKILVKEPENYDARAEVMWAGSLSHNGLTGCGTDGGDWATHKLEHELGGMFDVAHGAGLAAIWGSWARYVCGERIERFVQFAEHFMGVEPQETEQKTAEAGIAAMEDFYREIHMPTSLTELGIAPTEEQIKELAEKCNAAVRGNLGKVKHLDVEDMIAIYTAAK